MPAVTKPKKNVKIRSYAITVSPRGDILPGVHDFITAYIIACSFEHCVVLESDCTSGQLHLHAFVLHKELRTVSNFSKSFKKKVFSCMDDLGQIYDEKHCIDVRSAYNDDWPLTYLTKENKVLSKNLKEDPSDRVEAYELVPRRNPKNIEFNYKLTSLVEIFNQRHPSMDPSLITLARVTAFVWGEMRDNKMQVMYNPTVMIRFCRALRGFLLQSEQYDFSRMGPDTVEEL